MPLRRRDSLALALLLASLSPAGLARAQDEGALRAVAHQQLVALVNPLGAEHQLQVGVRQRIGDPAEPIFTDTHAEAGVVSATSPIYQRLGAYLSVSPLAILVLRAEIVSIAMWPIGVAGAGYYPAQGYDASPILEAEDGGSAEGWSMSLQATLQGAVPLGDVRLLAWNQFGLERASLGGSDYYFDARSDAVLARQDALLANRAMLLLEAAIDGVGTLRAGLYDDTRLVLGSGALANQVGVVAALAFEVEGHTFMPLARVGIYTDGRRALDPAILLGVQIDYDIGALPVPP